MRRPSVRLGLATARTKLLGIRRHQPERARSLPDYRVETAPSGSQMPLPHDQWKRNLVALWVAEFTAIFGFNFVTPFIAIYLHRDLGISSGGELDIWAGIAVGAASVSAAVASPIWGSLGDRYGRKSMLIRAMVGAGVLVSLMASVQSPWELLVLRVCQGAVSGTVIAATALVAVETPRDHIAWALGILSSAVALGGAVAPVAGGLAATFVGLRFVFIGAGVFLIASAAPVLLIVRESPSPRKTRSPRAALSSPRVTSIISRLLVVLVAALLLTQFGFALTQQVMALRLLYVDPRTATMATGVSFGVTGVAVAIGSLLYARVGALIGFRRFVLAACCLCVGALIGASLVGSVYATILCIAIFGFGYGILNPALYSMIGFATPMAYQATMFGISGSALEAGYGFGPFVGGAVAGATSVSVAFLLAAVTAALTGVLMVLTGSERVRHAQHLSQVADGVGEVGIDEREPPERPRVS